MRKEERSLLSNGYHGLRKTGLSSEIIATTVLGGIRTLSVVVGHPLHSVRVVQNMAGNKESFLNAIRSQKLRGGIPSFFTGFGANLAKVLGKEAYRYPLTSESFRRKLSASLPTELMGLSVYTPEIISSFLVSVADALSGPIDRAGTVQITHERMAGEKISATKAIHKIIKEEGSSQLFKGAPSLCLHHFATWLIFFIARKHYKSDDSRYTLAGDMAVGAVMALPLNAFDVVRHQLTGCVKAGASSRNVRATMFTMACAIAREQGAAKFLSGILPKGIMNAGNTVARGLAIDAGARMNTLEAEYSTTSASL